jgi:protein-disulfide isomerase
MKNHFGKIFLGVAVVAVLVSVVFAGRIGKQANEGVTITPHIKGNAAAAVTLTEYSDFQCPACGQFHPIVKDIMEQYGDMIALEYKHFPLITIHPFAVPAAKAAEAAAQQGKFFEMHDKLFENQATWSKSANPSAYFLTYAQELELDMSLFKRHLKASLIDDAVSGSFKNAQELGLSSTPTFFLNGTKMEFTSLAEFTSAIEAALGIVPVGATSSPTVLPAVQFGI